MFGYWIWFLDILFFALCSLSLEYMRFTVQMSSDSTSIFRRLIGCWNREWSNWFMELSAARMHRMSNELCSFSFVVCCTHAKFDPIIKFLLLLFSGRSREHKTGTRANRKLNKQENIVCNRNCVSKDFLAFYYISSSFSSFFIHPFVCFYCEVIEFRLQTKAEREFSDVVGTLTESETSLWCVA